MAIKHICDRCGSEISGKALYVSWRDARSVFSLEHVAELCERCYCEMYEFIEKQPEPEPKPEQKKLQRWETLTEEQLEGVYALNSRCYEVDGCGNCAFFDVPTLGPYCTSHTTWEWLHEEVEA